MRRISGIVKLSICVCVSIFMMMCVSYAEELKPVKISPQQQQEVNQSSRQIEQPKKAIEAGKTRSPLTKVTDKKHCYSFNPASTKVSEFKGGWAVMDSNDPKRAIVSFKQEKRSDADVALQVIHKYGMNQVCYATGLTYYLVSNQSPQGSYPGEKCEAFDPMALTIEQRPIQSKQKPGEVVGTNWIIKKGQQGLLVFRDNESAAREALAIIQQHGFTNSCKMGFTYFRK